MPALVLQPVDQAVGNVLAQQLTCWARTGRGATDPLVQYASCCASPTGASIGRWTIDAAVCAEYGPPPFTGNGGQIIDCSTTAEFTTYLIYDTDLSPIDPNTCQSEDEPLPPPDELSASSITDTSVTIDWSV